MRLDPISRRLPRRWDGTRSWIQTNPTCNWRISRFLLSIGDFYGLFSMELSNSHGDTRP